MMMRFFQALVLLTCGAGPLQAQHVSPSAEPDSAAASAGLEAPSPGDETLTQLRFDVAYLSSDLLQGRETGTAGERLAAAYIASRFEETGLSPAGSEDGWYQPFSFRHSDNPHAAPGSGAPRTGRNVVGVIDNGAGRRVVIGAHYDHLGFGGFGSRQPGDSLIHNGADDNASGVAVLLHVASLLKESAPASNDYVFVAFSGEELGLFGSKRFVNAYGRDSINYMVNFDMVGRLGQERVLAVNGNGTSPSWDAAVDASAQRHQLKLQKHASGLGPSDHASFYLADIPVLHLFTGQHSEYHKPADDSHLIDYPGLRDIAVFTADVIRSLDGPLEFTSTQDEDPSQRVSFRVTLGIMPDYVWADEGVRIDAVLADRPADRAGLAKGDIIIRLGPVDVGDINDYMEALSRFEPGDATTVVVRRGEETLERTVQY